MNEKQKEQTRKRVERYRNKKKSVTTDNNVTQGVTQEMVPASYVQGLNGRMYEVLPERPRFVTLSDGQVLDRANQPEAHPTGDIRMQAANESAYNFRPRKRRAEVVQ